MSGRRPRGGVMVHPKVEDFASQSEVLVQYTDDGPDSVGLRSFFAYWLAGNIGPRKDQYGVHGQVFVVPPATFAARQAILGGTVREWVP
ncbi:hypothetical protein SEA_BIPPER_47 [Mycobacterium phage Bipper]|uniref:Uncharacterized protein n=2 Tax=root TaxID=1 RepID=A0A142F2H5_9CAUD|nr:hypothetical protein KCH39_gp130 [Mycobacterium phage Bipper]AMQ66982.1 hypothetical protein SEA_BIPPER_47 [Mycobacterium phage Bipper]